VKRNIALLFLVSVAVLAGGHSKATAAPTAAAANLPPVNLAPAIVRAGAENKLLLLEFGSSDSCPPCIEFQRKVFSTPVFLAYEKSNLVFLRLDFPLKSELRPDTQATNVLLAHQFDVYAYPTFIALDRQGKESWRIPPTGDLFPEIDTRLYQPENFIRLLEGVRTKQK